MWTHFLGLLIRILRFAVDELVPGANTLETKPTVFCIRPKARGLLRGHVKIAVITLLLINPHEDIFRYISGQAVLDEDAIKIERKMYPGFFLLSPAESLVFQVCTVRLQYTE